MSRRRALLLAAGGLVQLSAPVLPTARAASEQPAVERLIAGRVPDTGQLPLASCSYRLTSFDEPGAADRLTVEAELAYRVQGFDEYPALLRRTLTFGRAHDGWQPVAEEPVGTPALWDLGTVRVASGRHCLVAGLVSGLPELAAIGDRAASAVSALWGSGWAGRLLIEIPETEAQFARLLSGSPAQYQGIAAVTTAVDGAPVHTPADRVLINPEAYAGLSEFGRQVVLTHECTHVATRAATRAWTPLWLSEGVADYTAYRAAGRTAAQIAPELTRDVAAGRLPGALPADADFAAGSDGIAQAYELAWLACRLIAERFGEQRLVALYRAVGSADPGADREGWLDRRLRAEIGLGTEAFTRLLLSGVQRSLGSG